MIANTYNSIEGAYYQIVVDINGYNGNISDIV